MSDSEIIWKFLNKELLDDHPIVYLYACGNVRSPNTALVKGLELLKPIFIPPMNEHMLKATIKGFLENKKKQYKNGEIKIKALY